MDKHFLERQSRERAIQSRMSIDLCVTSIVYSGHVKESRHAHGRALFCLLLRGDLSEQYCSKRINYQPGMAAFHPSDAEHATEVIRSGSHVFVIDIGNEWLKRLSEYDWTPKTIFDFHHGEMSWYAKKIFHAWNHDQETGKELQIEGLVLELLACLVKNETPHVPGWMPKIIELIKNEFQHPLTIQRIAKEFGIHPIQLSRVFRKATNQPLSEYVTRLRVEFASEQLRYTSKDLRQVALEAGFADQSHLTRTFKRFVGSTPANYRRTTRVRPGIHQFGS